MDNARTVILTSKPPMSGRWNDGIPGYEDNAAMKNGYIPDPKIVEEQYKGMVDAFCSTGIAEVLQVSFPNTQDLETIKGMKIAQDDIKKALGINEFMKNPNGNDLVDEGGEFTQHDFVFVRDSFISNQKDKILISNFSRRERRIEERVMKEILSVLLKENNIEREIITAPKSANFEGGNFRYIPDENILFAGENQRNNKEGVVFVKNQFDLHDNNILLVDGNGFHLDTYFSAVTGEDGKLVGGIICPHLVKNMSEVRDFFKNNKKILLEVDDHFGIGKEANGKGNFATNTLQLKNYLIGCNRFDDNTEYLLEKLGVTRIITPMSEYNKSGGANHCSSNQI